MNALAKRTPDLFRQPTPEEPLPRLAGTPGLASLRKGVPAKVLPTLTPTETSQAIEAAHAILQSLTPAHRNQIAISFERLALHYPTTVRTDRESDMAMADWIEDLAEFPADLIDDACRLWRNSAERFFPSAGQLLKPVRPILAHRQVLGRRAEQFIAAACNTGKP